MRGDHVYQRKDGRWEGHYIKQRAPDGNHPDYEQAKFESIAQDWITSIQSHVQLSTVAKYNNLLNSYIYPEFSDCTIDDITCDHVNSYCNELLTSGGCMHHGLSTKTVSDVLGLMRNIMRFAYDNGASVKTDIHPLSVKQQSKEMRILTVYEEELLCRYLYSNLNLCNLGILVCLFTGLRVGEICALRWADISFEDHTLFVHQTMQRVQVHDSSERKTKILISTPKSSCSIRTIPLSDHLYYALLEWKQAPETFFLTGSEEKYLEPRGMQNRFKTILKRLSIEDANFYSLRHTFATRCIELGFDIKSLSEILGHANAAITMNRYARPSMEVKYVNMQKLDQLFSFY